MSGLEKAILLTVHYRDLFGHAPTREELHRYLFHPCPDPAALAPALARLEGRYLTLRDACVTWKGREELVERRARRQQASAAVWPWAVLFGRWVRTIPFVKMAGVTGSLAVNNAQKGHDVDVFCVTEAHRLWLAVPFLSLLKHFSRRCLSVQFCPNTCLDENHLEFPEQNLYVAHQIAQMVPLWGEEVYHRFRAANSWVSRFLPNAPASGKSVPLAARSRRLERAVASALPQRAGLAANARLHQAGLRRALNHARNHGGPPAEIIAQARQLTCYRLAGSGYAPTIYRRFMDGHASRFAGLLTREEMQRVFGGEESHYAHCAGPVEQFFTDKYGRPA